MGDEALTGSCDRCTRHPAWHEIHVDWSDEIVQVCWCCYIDEIHDGAYKTSPVRHGRGECINVERRRLKALADGEIPCQVCQEPLSFGASDARGVKYAHYDRDDGHPGDEHYARSVVVTSDAPLYRLRLFRSTVERLVTLGAADVVEEVLRDA